jgi:hypothetical protein
METLRERKGNSMKEGERSWLEAPRQPIEFFRAHKCFLTRLTLARKVRPRPRPLFRKEKLAAGNSSSYLTDLAKE